VCSPGEVPVSRRTGVPIYVFDRVREEQARGSAAGSASPWAKDAGRRRPRTPNAYYDILSVLGQLDDISLDRQCSAPLPFFAHGNVAILGDAVSMERTSDNRTVWSHDAVASSFPGLQAHIYHSCLEICVIQRTFHVTICSNFSMVFYNSESTTAFSQV